MFDFFNSIINFYLKLEYTLSFHLWKRSLDFMRCRLTSSKRKSKYSNLILSKIESKHTSFLDLWSEIVLTFKDSFKDDTDKERPSDLDFSKFLFNSPPQQSYLTSNGKCIEKDIEWSNYNQIPPSEINIKNLFDCFHGILQYIYYNSEDKLNTSEVEFHYSNANSRISYESLSTRTFETDKCDILNIFDYENIYNYFQTPTTKNCFFGVSFKKIKIVPLCYSLRSDLFQNRTPHLDSFVFMGYDEEYNKWDVLDERVNINDLIPSGGYGLYFVKTTNKSYSSFAIRQIEPGHNGFWGFALAAFEIHGIPSFCTEEKTFPSIEPLFIEKSIEMPLSFNPCMDLSPYL